MSNRPFQLVLIDEDPVFRLGLKVWLEQFPEFQIVAEAETGTAALTLLSSAGQSSPPQTDIFPSSAASPSSNTSSSAPQPLAKLPSLVIVDVGLGRADPSQVPGLALCQQIRDQFPKLPVLVLSARPEPVLMAAAQQVNANGYCPRGLPVEELAAVIRQVAAGQSVWQLTPMEGDRPADTIADFDPPSSPQPSPQLSRSKSLGTLSRLRRTWWRLGSGQIEANLVAIARQLDHDNLSVWTQWVLMGQRRELLTARWILKVVLGNPAADSPEPDGVGETGSDLSETDRSSQQDQAFPRPSALQLKDEGALASSFDRVQALVFEAVMTKLRYGLRNGTAMPLEIDILRSDKKEALCHVILDELTQRLAELRAAQTTPEQLSDRQAEILQDLWLATTTRFFGQYAELQVAGQTVEVVTALKQEANLVWTTILSNIPLVPELLTYLLFQTQIVVEDQAYFAIAPQALARAEQLLENLVIQMANGVVQPLLRQFANREVIKQALYDRRMMSTREVERFRNSLSWRYGFNTYIKQPTAIFESRHLLLILGPHGIQTRAIYAPRQNELDQLSGVQFAVTLALEARDAIAPRLRAVIAFLGSGLIYILTEVIGRGIGLIGKGILQGVGSTWQDSKFSRSGRQR